MMLIEKNINYKDNLGFLILVIFANILLQLFIIYKIPKYSIVLLIGYSLLLFLTVVYQSHIKDLAVYLLILNFVPLIYLNNNFHYSFGFELITSIPLILFFIFFLLKFIASSKEFSIRVTYIQKPLIFIALYYTLIAFWDFANNSDFKWVTEQLYHIYLYLAIFPIYYFFTKRKHYQIVFLTLLIIAFLIAVEYIILDLFLLNIRFVTFQSGFLPVASGVLFAMLLYGGKNKHKITILFLFGIIILGTFVTLTRTLWVTTILILLFVWLLYLKTENRLNWRKVVLLIIIVSLPLMFIGDINKPTKRKVPKSEMVEYRAQSITNPLEDSSFLMRLEFAYYAGQRFLESPVIGNGLRDYLKYKIFNFNKAANYYIDNSWLYFLWKGGLIGFLLFVWVYVRFFKTAFYILKNGNNLMTKVLTIGFLAGLMGLTLLAFLSPLLIKYRSNIIFPLIFAYTEFEKNMIDKQPIKEV